MPTTVSEKRLSELLDIPVTTLKSWRRKRLIPYRKLGRLVRYEEKEIEDWVKRGKVPALA